MPLIGLLQDLMRNAPLRRRFVENPGSVMDEYALKPRQRRILLTMDPTVIKNAVPAEMRPEIDDFKFDGDEFLPGSDEFLSEFGGIDPQYPSPKPGIFRYRINPPFLYDTKGGQVRRGFSAAIVNATTTSAIELTVYGQSFSDVDLKLTRTSDNAPAVPAANLTFLLGTFRNSIVRGVFNAPAADAGVWTVNDKYRVSVLNQKSAPLQLQFESHDNTLLEVLP